MERMSVSFKDTKSIWPFLIGVVSAYGSLQVWYLLPEKYPYWGLLVEYLILACGGCFSVIVAMPQQAGIISKIISGCFVGVALDIVVHPTVNVGFERNLFPIEIAIHMFIAVISVIPSVLICQNLISRRR